MWQPTSQEVLPVHLLMMLVFQPTSQPWTIGGKLGLGCSSLELQEMGLGSEVTAAKCNKLSVTLDSPTTPALDSPATNE